MFKLLDFFGKTPWPAVGDQIGSDASPAVRCPQLRHSDYCWFRALLNMSHPPQNITAPYPPQAAHTFCVDLPDHLVLDISSRVFTHAATDPVLGPVFHKSQMRAELIHQNVLRFVCHILSNLAPLDISKMQQGHAKYGVTDAHFDAMMYILDKVLKELLCEEEERQKRGIIGVLNEDAIQLVLDKANSLRSKVLGDQADRPLKSQKIEETKPPPTDVVPDIWPMQYPLVYPETPSKSRTRTKSSATLLKSPEINSFKRYSSFSQLSPLDSASESSENTLGKSRKFGCKMS